MEGAVYIVIKLLIKWFHGYAFSFHLMVTNDKLKSMIGIAFQSDESVKIGMARCVVQATRG